MLGRHQAGLPPLLWPVQLDGRVALAAGAAAAANGWPMASALDLGSSSSFSHRWMGRWARSRQARVADLLRLGGQVSSTPFAHPPSLGCTAM